MKITNKDLSNMSLSELRDLNHIVIEEIKRKRTIESLQMASIINVGDTISCSSDKRGEKYIIKQIKRTTIVAENTVTKIRYQMPISLIVTL